MLQQCAGMLTSGSSLRTGRNFTGTAELARQSVHICAQFRSVSRQVAAVEFRDPTRGHPDEQPDEPSALMRSTDSAAQYFHSSVQVDW